MRILIERNHYDDKQTLGTMYLLNDEDHIIKSWFSLELPWKDNKSKVSCIPEGSYNAYKHISPKFGNSFWIKDVPNRSEILIHKGNYHSDILGCILIGMDLKDINKDGYFDVTSSKVAISELLELTKDFDVLPISILSI